MCSLTWWNRCSSRRTACSVEIEGDVLLDPSLDALLDPSIIKDQHWTPENSGTIIRLKWGRR